MNDFAVIHLLHQQTGKSGIVHMKKQQAVTPRKRRVIKAGERLHLKRNRLNRLVKKSTGKEFTLAQRSRLNQLKQELVDVEGLLREIPELEPSR